MIKKQKDTQKSDGGIFRILELVIESIGWLQIVASPLLIGFALGAIIYLSDPTTIRLVIGIAVTMVGLILGILWANKHWRGKGTIWFLSRIMATPELDNTIEESNKLESIRNDREKRNR